MNILITGGIGFIGSNAAIFFLGLNKKNKITLIDNFSRFGVLKNAKFLKKNYPKIKIIKSNVGDINKYLPYIKSADVIIHLAGQTAVTTSIAKPKEDFDNNLFQSFILLETVKRHNPKAILIYSSTNKVYGSLKKCKIKKNRQFNRYIDVCHPRGIGEDEQLHFISPYGCSKGAIDQYFLDYAAVYGLKTIVFRQSCVYGPFQIGVEDQGWVAHFVKQFLLKKSLTIYGDGFQVRDLLYVTDLIDCYHKAIVNIAKTKGHVFNVGGGINNSYSLLQIIGYLEKITGNKIPVILKPERLGDQKIFVSSNEKINKILGWKPITGIGKGLASLINWQKNNLFNQ